MEPNIIIRTGYNQIAELYNQKRIDKKDANYCYFNALSQYFPSHGKLLDIGCGVAIPVCSYFKEKGFEIFGIDISEEMIALAKKQIPDGKFEVGDMMEMNYHSDTFDLITSTFAIIHIPQEKQLNLLVKIYSYLKTNGVAYLVLGDKNQKEIKREWHGVEMYWSYYSSEEYKDILLKIGFHIIWEEIENLPNGEIFYNLIVGK